MSSPTPTMASLADAYFIEQGCFEGVHKMAGVPRAFIANASVGGRVMCADAIKKYPEPTTVTEVRGFLGLCNFYSKLIRSYSAIAAPLSDAIKGNAGKVIPALQPSIICSAVVYCGQYL